MERAEFRCFVKPIPSMTIFWIDQSWNRYVSVFFLKMYVKKALKMDQSLPEAQETGKDQGYRFHLSGRSTGHFKAQDSKEKEQKES